MTIERFKEFIDEFENEADDEWNLDPEKLDHFAYWFEQKTGIKMSGKTDMDNPPSTGFHVERSNKFKHDLVSYLDKRIEHLWDEYQKSDDNAYRFQRRHRTSELEMIKSRFLGLVGGNIEETPFDK